MSACDWSRIGKENTRTALHRNAEEKAIEQKEEKKMGETEKNNFSTENDFYY